MLAGAGAFFLFRKKPEDSDENERERRVYLNRIGRIVEGHILEVVDHAAGEHTSKPEPKEQPEKRAGLLGKRGVVVKNGAQKLLYYSYSISFRLHQKQLLTFTHRIARMRTHHSDRPQRWRQETRISLACAYSER